jgi:hypothetical protein
MLGYFLRLDPAGGGEAAGQAGKSGAGWENNKII